MKFLKLVLFCLVITSCKEPVKGSFASFNEFIHQNIAQTLKTEKDKIEYLTKLFDFDQSLRNSDQNADILKRSSYNIDSEEYKDYRIKMIQGDSICFILTKKYLDQFAYPKFEMNNYKARSAIITVALHQDYSKQEILFPYILEAYNLHNIEEDRFSFLINRMYDFKFRERFTSKKGLTENENINQIIMELNLEN